MMNLFRWLERPGAGLGALVDGLVFAAMLAVWYALEPRSAGTHTADTGAMSLLLPFVIGFTLVICAVLSAASSVLGAFAGYWAKRTRSPVTGAVAGLAAGALAAGPLAVLFPGEAASMGAAWLAKMKWLVPPAAVAGIVVGIVEMRRKDA